MEYEQGILPMFTYFSEVLTCRTVMACPVGITAAGSGVCQESAVSRALVHAGGPGNLTSWPAPTYKAVALSLDTYPSA